MGAIHSDASTGQAVPRAVQPYCEDNLPSIVNAQGMGYRRAIKPEIFLPGGRTVLVESFQQSPNAVFDIYTQSRQPGQRVAAPGPAPGDLSYTWYGRGTSYAAALASRTATRLYDVLDELRQAAGGEIIEAVPYAVWLKALLVHGANWGTAGDILTQILRNPVTAVSLRNILPGSSDMGLSIRSELVNAVNTELPLWEVDFFKMIKLMFIKFRYRRL